jgi:hypothetical protein
LKMLSTKPEPNRSGGTHESCSPTSRARATSARNRECRPRMAAAKHRFSLAALACLRNALDAPALVHRALQEIEQARAALREVRDA